MTPRTQQPGDDEVLILYLAEELPAEQREALVRRLEADPDLRGQLQALEAAQRQWSAGLAALDATARLGEQVAGRRVSDAMRGWLARRADALLHQAPAPPRLRYVWWAYPLAAAAAIVVAFLLWWGNTDRLPGPTEVSPRHQIARDPMRGYRDDWAMQQWQWEIETGPQPVSFGRGMIDDFTRHDGLRQVEREMLTLQDRPQDWDLFGDGP